MEKINIITSYAAPLPMAGINTDIISPMKRNIYPCDLGLFAFEPIRYIDGDGDIGQPDPSFPFNRPPYKNARILLAGENFGCGSSRETAAIGIARMGVQCIISNSFGGIFMRNCYQQGILPILLPQEQTAAMFKQTENGPFMVNLPEQTVTMPDGTQVSFAIERFRKDALLNGLDMISATLRYKDDILSYKAEAARERPWIFLPVDSRQ